MPGWSASNVTALDVFPGKGFRFDLACSLARYDYLITHLYAQ